MFRHRHNIDSFIVEVERSQHFLRTLGRAADRALHFQPDPAPDVEMMGELILVDFTAQSPESSPDPTPPAA